jgi:hypothetical protein
MRKHDKGHVEDGDEASIDAFLAEAPFVETPGVDDEAIRRDELLRKVPDAASIAESIELLNEHHQTD